MNSYPTSTLLPYNSGYSPSFYIFIFFYLHLPCSCPASVLLLPSFCLLSGRPDVSPWLRIILSKLHPQVLPHSTPAADQDLGESQGEEWAEKKHVPTQSPLMMRSSALSAAGNQSRALVPFLLFCPVSTSANWKQDHLWAVSTTHWHFEWCLCSGTSFHSLAKLGHCRWLI